MTECLPRIEQTIDGDGETAQALHDVLASRRSIRRLQDGPFSIAARERLLAAIRLTPASFNLPPWRVVLVHDRREALWAEIAGGFHETLQGDQLERYLDRLTGFSGGVAVALVFVDSAIEKQLRDEKHLAPEVAASYVLQALGMVQMALWLAVTAEGMATSLQHWDNLVGPRLARFAGLEPNRYRLIATMPIGCAAEEPKDVTRAESGKTA
ncbi:MAG: nitroreductase family protein [Thermomicrobiales bacterium]